MTVTALVASALLMGATGQTRYAAHDERPIATPPPYPTNIVDDTRRPGFNGRLWHDRAIVGGAVREYPLGWGSPGPAHYGAPETLDPTVYVRRDAIVIGVGAWERVGTGRLYRIEEARNFWLHENNYVGGVRTHIAPAVRQGVLRRETAPYVIEPRARFRAPEDAPKIKRRMQVQAPGRDLDNARVFLPDAAPIAMRDRVEAQATVAQAD